MIGFYRALLRLYPASFRAEYGDELCAAFTERLRATSRARAILGAIADVLPNALAAHFDIVRQDLRYGARTFRRAPGFAFTVILIVALGIGANTAAFSLADFVLLRPLPFPEPDQLVKIWNNDDGVSQVEASPPNYRDWKAMATRSFSGMGAYAQGAFNLVGLGTPRRVQAALVTPELMPLIGVTPLLGSVIAPANKDAGLTAVLSHDLWRTQFAADPGVVGRVVRLDGTPYTIIGVMPANFRFPNRSVEVWAPLILEAEDAADRTNAYFNVIGRLEPGATLEGARAELSTIASRLERQYPDTNKDMRIFLHRLRDEVGQRSRLLVIALCGASLCILLLACANLASLLLARGSNRGRELAIRTALGAGRERLVRQLVTETILLSIIGGSVGVFIAWAGLPLLAQLVPTTLPIQEVPTIDLRVLAFAAVLMVLTGLGFGAFPALRTQRVGARQRLRSALVILEVTGSVVLLISSGLLMRAIWRIQAVETGFRTEEVMTMRTALPLPKYAVVAARDAFYGRVLEQVRAIPGVKSAAYTTGLPMVRTGGIWSVEIAGDDNEDNRASLRFISPGYFATMSIPMRRGRDISVTDTQRRRPYAAVVSESLVQRHWPNQDPIGRVFKFAQEERMVVGVVGDVRVRGRERQSEPQVYVSSSQIADNSIIGYIPHDLAIRSALPPEQLLPAVRRIIASADPEQPISSVRPLAEIVADDTAPRRVQIRVLAILSAIALLIAGVGVHGLLSFAVAQRTKELGVRRALGAQDGGIVTMILRDGVRLAAIGTAIGVGVAILVGRGMSALLFGVPPTDVRTIAAAAALCMLTALIGCLRPALRAVSIDPMIALREN
ncbi:MAG TPA: ABC transporter permease [Thermoanaerobaculia bacterium]|nr:ABC transporter permease [Thermoanaerobaculia bacterium]